jgi:cell division protein FtsQ
VTVMKAKAPKNSALDRDSVANMDRVVGANRLFERDVLLEAPSKEPRVRSFFLSGKEFGDKKLTDKKFSNKKLGDKKLTTRDAFERRSVTSKSITIESGKTVRPKVSVRPDVSVRSKLIAAVETSEPQSFDDPISTYVEKSLRRERGYSNTTPKGKSRAEVEGRTEFIKTGFTKTTVFRFTGLLMLLSIFAGVAYFVSDPIAHLLERPLKSVAVEGNFQFLSKDRAMALILEDIDGDFLQIDLEHLKTLLESDPWVEHVFLSRRWPDTLVVKIAEQKPIARWDTNGFLNQRGEIIRVKETDKLIDLPWLQGDEANAYEIMRQYQDLSTLLRSRGLEIVTLTCDSKKSWRINLKNNIEIAIGRDQVMEKLGRFVTAYDNFLRDVWSDVQAIDVRYTNGVAVRWIPESAMANKFMKTNVTTAKK